MAAPDSSVSQIHLQQFRACLGICRSCLETTKSSAKHRAGLMDLVLALEIAVAMIETQCQHTTDRLQHCAEVFTSIAKSWFEGGTARCRACIRVCEEVLQDWGASAFETTPQISH
ncbi:hypothetical protein FUA23_19305 [Neolewinella aurantiaca]|uniref:Uncharacterized protein n=1 Tax=Neolewinella aurantiaca TaxID=2602767 RepID=A0A5C7F9D2_9BACT|nr:hypothetical protein [Neolewinella aurantiaca]TXF86653.1 hypothetical protein FUA23_19305 [Neolewinella aurantiaca]